MILTFGAGHIQKRPTIAKLQKGRCNKNNTLYVHKNACIKTFINQNYKWLNDSGLQSPEIKSTFP